MKFLKRIIPIIVGIAVYAVVTSLASYGAIYSFCVLNAGVPQTGLSPEFFALKNVADGTDVSKPSIAEIGGGCYRFSHNATANRVGFINADPGGGLSATDTYVQVYLTPDDENLDTTVSSRAAPSDIIDDATPFSGADIGTILADTNELQGNQNWDVWDDGARTLTDKTGFSLSANQNAVTIGLVNGLTSNAKAEINAEADTALTDYDAPTNTEMNTAFGITNSLVNTAISNIAGAQADLDNPGQYKADVSSLAIEANVEGHVTDALSLYNGPTYDELQTAQGAIIANIPTQVWDAAVADHQSADTFGALVNSTSATPADIWGYSKRTLTSIRQTRGIYDYQTIITDDGTIEVLRGDEDTKEFQLDVDLTGKKVYFIAQETYDTDNTDAIINREMTITDASNGVVEITITTTESATIGSYVAEVEVRDTDDTSPWTAWQGILEIKQDIRQ